MGGGNQSRLKALAAAFDGLFNIQGTHQAILAGPYRQVNDTHLAANRGGIAAAGFAPLAQSLPAFRGAAVGAALQYGHFGQ